jgi:RNA polymerase sigma-70 factor, ECF subfamily
MEVKRKGEGPDDSVAAAFADICRAMTPYLRRFLLSRGASVDDVPDLLQETLLRFWQRRETVEEGKERAFLHAVALHVLQNHRRKAHSRKALDSANQETVSASTHAETSCVEQVGHRVLQEERRKALSGLLDSLPERQRDVLRLLYLEGHSRKQVAANLGCSLDSLYQLEKRGLTALRDHVEENSLDFFS